MKDFKHFPALTRVLADSKSPILGKEAMIKKLKELEFEINEAIDESGVKLPNGDKEVKVVPKGYDEAMFQKEDDGKIYHYPEMLNFNVESGSTFKLSLIADGRIIPEGKNLSGKGWTHQELIDKVLHDIYDWANRAARAKNKNQ